MELEGGSRKAINEDLEIEKFAKIHKSPGEQTVLDTRLHSMEQEVILP